MPALNLQFPNGKLESKEAIADKPSLSELVDRLKEQEGADIGNLAAEIIREHRGPLP